LLTFQSQATFPTNVSAAFVALFDVLDLPAPWQDDEPRPSSLLIVGGGSNCGKFAVQLAKLAKIQNIIVVGGDEPLLRKLGATHVIDRHLSEDAVVAKVHELAGNDLSYALDAVNMPEGLGLALRALSDRRPGKVARLLPVGKVEDARGHELLNVLGLFLYRKPECVAMWERLTDLVAAGAICPTSFSMLEGLEADSVNAALDGYRDGTNRNKPQIRL
jgi:NADPH2:quinone reductase